MMNGDTNLEAPRQCQRAWFYVYQVRQKSNPLNYLLFSQQPLPIFVWNFTGLRDYPIYI